MEILWKYQSTTNAPKRNLVCHWKFWIPFIHHEALRFSRIDVTQSQSFILKFTMNSFMDQLINFKLTRYLQKIFTYCLFFSILNNIILLYHTYHFLFMSHYISIKCIHLYQTQHTHARTQTCTLIAHLYYHPGL